MSKNIKQYTSEKEINYWPKIPNNAQLIAQEMLESCLKTQWQSAEDISMGQMNQLNTLLGYAQFHSQYYAKILPKINDTQNDALFDVWDQIPTLKLEELAQKSQLLACDDIPPGHGNIQNYPIALPDNNPIPAITTGLWFVMLTAWMARIYSDYGWGQTSALVELRRGAKAGYREVPGGWGIAAKTGDRYIAQVDSQRAQSLSCLKGIKDDIYLMCEAELLPIVKENVDAGTIATLKGSIVYVRTAQDFLLCKKMKDEGMEVVPVIMYSGLGIIASPCPERGNFHINSEAIYYEEIYETPVLSILHNYALPIIRLECPIPIKKSLECDCGRGTPTVEFNL